MSSAGTQQQLPTSHGHQSRFGIGPSGRGQPEQEPDELRSRSVSAEASSHLERARQVLSRYAKCEERLEQEVQ